jgi:hypothetical protein
MPIRWVKTRKEIETSISVPVIEWLQWNGTSVSSGVIYGTDMGLYGHARE